jgi:hypothetical protein
MLKVTVFIEPSAACLAYSLSVETAAICSSETSANFITDRCENPDSKKMFNVTNIDNELLMN